MAPTPWPCPAKRGRVKSKHRKESRNPCSSSCLVGLKLSQACCGGGPPQVVWTAERSREGSHGLQPMGPWPVEQASRERRLECPGLPFSRRHYLDARNLRAGHRGLMSTAYHRVTAPRPLVLALALVLFSFESVSIGIHPWFQLNRWLALADRLETQGAAATGASRNFRCVEAFTRFFSKPRNHCKTVSLAS